MCCCKFPPSVGLTIYVLLSVLIGLYFRQVKSIYLTHLEYDIEGTEESDDFNNLHVKFDVGFDKLNNLEKNFSGNVSVNFKSDEDIRITSRGIPASHSTSDMSKTYINNWSFCKIMDYHVYNRNIDSAQKEVSLCPVQAGFSEIYGNNYEFSDLAVSGETGGHKTFHRELIRRGNKIACKQFRFINSGVENSFRPKNGL